MPLGDGITFSYGDYDFDPRPLFNVNKEIIKTPSNTGLGTKYTLTLNGTILNTDVGLDDFKGGLNTVFTGVKHLQNAFSVDFDLLVLKCDDEDPIISGYPKIVSLDFTNSSDNYVRRADYTINLELPTLTGVAFDEFGLEIGGGDLTASGLISVTEDISIEFLDERLADSSLDLFTDDELPTIFTISKNLTAQGASFISGNSPLDESINKYVEPWQRAQAYVQNNLASTGGFDSYFSGAMCVDGMHITSTFRTISVNHTDGSCAGTQTFVAYTGAYAAVEDFEASMEGSHDTAMSSVTINGTIQGFNTDIAYTGASSCPPTGNSKFDNALAKWGSVSGSLFNRALLVYESGSHNNVRNLILEGATPLNLKPLSYSLGYNPIAGTVTYSVSYDDRIEFWDPTAISETISITRNYGPDMYASLTILGRVAGPLLQGLGTVGPTTSDITVDVVYPPYRSDNNSPNFTNWLINQSIDNRPTIYNVLFANPSNGFVTSDTETWDPAAGHYTHSKSWELGSC